MSAKPRLITWERTGKWAVRLQQFMSREHTLRQTRSKAACLTELEQAPSSLLIVEVSLATLQDVLALLETVRERFPHARVIAVAERDAAEFEWICREAGAIHFASSTRGADDVARLFIRHVAIVPLPRQSVATQVWESLPWPESAEA